MDNPKSDWIWTNPISESNSFWISMNMYNNRGALVITNAPVINSIIPLVSFYFGTKATKKYKI